MAMYKITCKCSRGTEYESNPITPAAPNCGQYFIKYTYTKNKKLADYYEKRIETISIEEVDESEYINIAAFYGSYAGDTNEKALGFR